MNNDITLEQIKKLAKKNLYAFSYQFDTAEALQEFVNQAINLEARTAVPFAYIRCHEDDGSVDWSEDCLTQDAHEFDESPYICRPVYFTPPSTNQAGTAGAVREFAEKVIEHLQNNWTTCHDCRHVARQIRALLDGQALSSQSSQSSDVPEEKVSEFEYKEFQTGGMRNSDF